jgi:hypothetical protein
VHEVQVRRDRQIAGELAVLLHAHGTDRDFGGAAHEVEDAHAQQARKTLVDDFEARHAATNDTLLRRDVVGTYALLVGLVRILVDFTGDALEEGIDLLLGHELVVTHRHDDWPSIAGIISAALTGRRTR